MIHGLCRELHSAGTRVEAPSMDSRLEWDLGLDSLARIELLSRLEQRFGATVVAREVVEAETVGEVVFAVGGPRVDRGSRPERSFGTASRSVVALTGVPDEPAQVLPDLLTHLVARDPGFVCVRLLESNGGVDEVRADDLLAAARGVARGLGRQIEAAEPVAVMLPTGRAFLEAFFGILLAGGVPVPLAPAARPSQTEDHLLRQVQILDSCRATQLISSSEVAALARLLRPRAETLRRVVTVEQLKKAESGVAAWRARPDDLALLQYTSGSTGLPKGVRLTHANLLSNLEAISRGLETGPDDVFVSWLPLYHDMGLIGGLLHPLHTGIPLILLSPLAFLSRPESWIQAIDEYRGTQTVAPNFAYEICQRRAAGLELDGIDLSCLRLALNGAEPVSPATIRRFAERFAPHGFRPEAMLPVYGLAESSLAVTFPELGHEPREDRVDRDVLLSSGRAVAAREGVPYLSFVSCGIPVRGVELRLIDEAGREVEDREIGRVEFRGPSATDGYYRDESATRELVANGWVDSGDLGYVADGELYLTGRSKDLVIHAGRNISPHAVEEAVGDLPGVRKGCVAVFGVEDAALGTERLVIAAETREAGEDRRAELVAAINETASKVVGVAPDDVCLVPPHALLKTSSGKIRRLACGRLYQEGSLSRPGGRALWLQMLRVAGLSVVASVRRAAARLPALLYSAYLWCLVAVLLPTIWVGAMVLPKISWRRGLGESPLPGFLQSGGLDSRTARRRPAAGGPGLGRRRQPRLLSRYDDPDGFVAAAGVVRRQAGVRVIGARLRPVAAAGSGLHRPAGNGPTERHRADGRARRGG